jgi:hypothetical protein
VAGVLFLVEAEIAFDVFQSASFVEDARVVKGTPLSSSGASLYSRSPLTTYQGGCVSLRYLLTFP